MRSDERLIYTNAFNEAVNIGYDYDLLPVSFSEDLDNDINTSKFNLQNGETYISSSLNNRKITIKATYKIVNAQSIERTVIKTIEPTSEGTLTKISGSSVKTIKVRATQVPAISRQAGRGVVTIDLVALYPFWQTYSQRERLAKQTNLLRFPVTFKEKRFGIIIQALNAELQNVGDIYTGFNVTFTANGEISNPALVNNLTGERLQIKKDMAQGDVIKIVNMPYHKEVYYNGVKNFAILDRNKTTFFNLLAGKNYLGVDADNNALLLEVYIEYAPKYLI